MTARGAGRSASLARSGLLLASLALAAAPWPSKAQAAPAPAENLDANLVLLEVRLDGQVLADAVSAYQIGRDVYLPLGEMARLLTLAIRVDAEAGRAGGYILREDRVFSLDVPGRAVQSAGAIAALDAAQVRVLADDIYVASRQLARWLPVDVDVDMGNLALAVRPREPLPLQSRLARRERGGMLAGGRAPPGDPGYPRLATPYRALSVPFVDQTLSVDAGHDAASADAPRAPPRHTNTSYTGYLTADLAGMEAALYATRNRQDPSAGMRMTVGRNDPDGELLGPLHARTLLAGSIAVPGVDNLSSTSATGNGIVLSNRPLDRPTSFDRTSLQGILPPGWDVELYYNEALVGFQQSRPDGKYVFEDLPLAYGPNEFRLVFHGPLGQSRVERRHFLLEQSAVPRGTVYYDVAAQRDQQGRQRVLAQAEWGMGEHANLTGGWQRVPVADRERTYARAGVRGYWSALIVTGDAIRADDGGRLAQVGVKTRLAGIALSASRARLDNYTSELFPENADPVRVRDAVRAEGTILAGAGTTIPLAFEVHRDGLASGSQDVEAQARIAVYRDGTALSNALHWQSLAGRRTADGLLQASRRVAGIGLTGQLEYRVKPRGGLGSATLYADRMLADGYQLNLGLARAFAPREVRASVALNKSLGSFGLGVNAFRTSRHAYGAGIQFFLALGREPRRPRLLAEAQPMAGMGSASMRVFLDRNGNGVLDAGDEPVKNAGFLVNGASYLVRTDAAGLAYLPRLPAHQHMDIGLATDTLEDPQWQPRTKGVRIVPRPGAVSEIDFAVSTTGEVDGTAYLRTEGKRRPAGDLQLELVDDQGKVVSGVATAPDGYYVITGIFPGRYLLRVAPEQLARLGLRDPGTQPVVIGLDGTVLNGRDVEVMAAR